MVNLQNNAFKNLNKVIKHEYFLEGFKTLLKQTFEVQKTQLQLSLLKYNLKFYQN